MSASPAEQIELFRSYGFNEVACSAAVATGILYGWSESVMQSGRFETIEIRCVRCRIGRCYDVSKEWLYGSKLDLRSSVEQRMEFLFAEDAKQRNCPHWEQYLLLRRS